MLCEYGCETESAYQLKNGKFCCSKRPSGCAALKKINAAAVLNARLEGRGGYDYSLLPEETKQNMNWNKGNFSSVEFIHGGIGNHKAALLAERGHTCEECKLSEWLGKPIPLELEHTDGDNRNNTRENLKLLCCNCHALTPTWRGRNINSGRVKVTDEDLLTAYAKCSNIRQALIEVGLAAKGGNYERMKRLIS